MNLDFRNTWTLRLVWKLCYFEGLNKFEWLNKIQVWKDNKEWLEKQREIFLIFQISVSKVEAEVFVPNQYLSISFSNTKCRIIIFLIRVFITPWELIDEIDDKYL